MNKKKVDSILKGITAAGIAMVESALSRGLIWLWLQLMNRQQIPIH